MHIAITILISFLLSEAEPTKEKAREYLKEQLSGWKEKIALAVFDAAWDAALSVVGAHQVGTLTKEQANLVASVSVAADKTLSA